MYLHVRPCSPPLLCTDKCLKPARSRGTAHTLGNTKYPRSRVAASSRYETPAIMTLPSSILVLAFPRNLTRTWSLCMQPARRSRTRTAWRPACFRSASLVGFLCLQGSLILLLPCVQASLPFLFLLICLLVYTRQTDVLSSRYFPSLAPSSGAPASPRLLTVGLLTRATVCASSKPSCSFCPGSSI